MKNLQKIENLIFFLKNSQKFFFARKFENLKKNLKISKSEKSWKFSKFWKNLKIWKMSKILNFSQKVDFFLLKKIRRGFFFAQIFFFGSLEKNIFGQDFKEKLFWWLLGIQNGLLYKLISLQCRIAKPLLLLLVSFT